MQGEGVLWKGGREGCNLLCRELTGNCYYKYLDTLEGNSHVINQYSSAVNIQLSCYWFSLDSQIHCLQSGKLLCLFYHFLSLCGLNLHCEVLVNCNKSWGKYSIHFESVRSYSFLRKIIKLIVQINQFYNKCNLVYRHGGFTDPYYKIGYIKKSFILTNTYLYSILESRSRKKVGLSVTNLWTLFTHLN